MKPAHTYPTTDKVGLLAYACKPTFAAVVCPNFDWAATANERRVIEQ